MADMPFDTGSHSMWFFIFPKEEQVNGKQEVGQFGKGFTHKLYKFTEATDRPQAGGTNNRQMKMHLAWFCSELTLFHLDGFWMSSWVAEKIAEKPLNDFIQAFASGTMDFSSGSI